jgi:hypothetical protein
MRPTLAAILLVALALATGCEYRGGDIAEPVQRRAQWFSYVGGDDLRADCAPGRPTRYRFVYNATFDEQVRTYDLDRLPVGDGALVRVRVLRGGARILQYWLLDQLGSPAPTTFMQDIRINEEQYLALVCAVERSGFGEPPPVGLQLPSWDFFWIVTACAEGRFHLNAWRQPRWERVEFAEPLFAADPIGVPVRRPPTWPRSWTEADHRVATGRSMSNRDNRQGDDFMIQIGTDGLAGTLR